MPPQPASPEPPRGSSRRAAIFGGTQHDAIPGGLAAHVLEFAEELRAEGVAVGTSASCSTRSRRSRRSPGREPVDFREALAATLAKSPEDRRVFELVFDRFFFRAAELAAIQEGVREQGASGGDGRGRRASSTSTTLREQIAQALRDGDESAMRDLARLAIAAFGRQGEGSGVIGVDVQRIRRALGLRSEPQPELPEHDPRREGLPREQLRRFEQLLRRELERAPDRAHRAAAAGAAAQRARPRAADRPAAGPRRACTASSRSSSAA